jgi:hypothetical protein
MERLVLGVDRAGTFGKFLGGVLPVRLVQPFGGVLLRPRYAVSAVGRVPGSRVVI